MNDWSKVHKTHCLPLSHLQWNRLSSLKPLSLTELHGMIHHTRYPHFKLPDDRCSTTRSQGLAEHPDKCFIIPFSSLPLLMSPTRGVMMDGDITDCSQSR